jgi:hypothetical protein
VKALQDGTLTPAEAAEELAAIAEGTALMVSITSDMTDIAKLRAGHFAVALAPTPLRRVLESCVLAVKPAVARAGDVELVYAPDAPEMVSVAQCVYGRWCRVHCAVDLTVLAARVAFCISVLKELLFR